MNASGDDRDHYRKSLVDAVVSGVRGSLSAFRQAHPGERLWAYALITDDDLDGVGYFACTEEFLELEAPRYARLLGANWDVPRALEELRFMPVDWIHNEGVHALDPASALLRADSRSHESPEAFMRHVDESFRCLVEGLRTLRQEGLFATGVFLFAISTDPSDHLVDLEEEGVRALNPHEEYARWKAVMR